MTPAKKRILCIAYDVVVLRTREMLLEYAGFKVTTAVGFAEAMEHCQNAKFDLIVMGHPVPHKDMSALVGALRSMHCDAPVLSVRRHYDPPLPEADFSVELDDGPLAFVAAVKSAVTRKARPSPN